MSDPFNYKGDTLARKRQKLKLSHEDVAQQLTLSVSQIISLEKNLDSGFATPHFRMLAIKRYSKLLNLDLKSVVIQETKQVDSSNEFVEVSKKSTFSFNWVLIILGFVAILIFIFSQSDSQNDDANIIAHLEKEIIENDNNLNQNENNQADDLPFSSELKSNEVTTHSKPENENKPITESSVNNEGVNIDFICTINATAVKEFSTINPEKPANYFHLISIEPQTICTVDNLGNKKTYQLEEGGKVTHRGEPPFKIQLDPNKSRLYFQGWIVHLQPQDRFIQLNPKELIDLSN
ncbi:MAG: helix-turn-helix domain-containing protein [Methylophilaceae bacterium]